MKGRTFMVLGLAALGGAAFIKSQNKPTETELVRVYALAMSPTMVNVGELEWASALLRSRGWVGQADMVDMKIQALRAAPVRPTAPGPGLIPGHHYTAKIQLTGLEAAFGGSSDVKAGVEKAIGMPVEVESLGSGAYLASGTWSGLAMPYPVPLPDRVQWIRDDTSGEVIT
jgi:hypothetical protein